MPARTVRFGSPRRAALLSVLWLVAVPTIFAQSDLQTDARKSDIEGKTGEGTLPKDLIQAREVLPEMQIINELYTDADELDFRRKWEISFNNALKSSTLTDDEKKALDAGAKHFIYRFSMKKYFEEEPPKKDGKPAAPGKGAPKERLHDLRKKLLDHIKFNVKSKEVREYFQKQLMERAEHLLDNNFVVRQNIILLLGQLSSDNGNPAKNIEPLPYAPVYSVLLKVIKDEKQHQALKIDALLGLLRICRLGLPLPDAGNEKKRAEIAMALVPELAKTNTYYWYQFRLAECLGAAGVAYDPANKTNPIVLQTLAEVVFDKSRHWLARAEAAKAIGRLPIDGQLNMTPVIYGIVQLGYEMVQGYNANPKREAWVNYFFTGTGYGLYYTFKAVNKDDRTPGGKRKPGLLEALPASKEVKDGYEQVLQMTLHFIESPGKQFNAAELNGFDNWLRNHVPTNNRITNNSPPLDSKPAAAPETKPVKANGKPETNPVGDP